MAVMYASYSLRMEEAIKESVAVVESSESTEIQLMRVSRMVMVNNSTKSSTMFDVLIVLFTFLAQF